MSDARVLKIAVQPNQPVKAGQVLVRLDADEGHPVPEPSGMDTVLSSKVVRVNITLQEDALAEIDRYAEAKGYSRSGFLVAAAKRAMEAV